MGAFISTLADISLMWLIILSFIACLIPLAAVGGVVYGMYKTLKFLPPVFSKSQEISGKVLQASNKATNKVAEPFIVITAFSRRVTTTIRSLFKLLFRRQT